MNEKAPNEVVIDCHEYTYTHKNEQLKYKFDEILMNL